MKPDVNSPAYVLAFAAVASGLFTAAIMSLHAATQGVVERNEQAYEQRALLEVFGLTETAAAGREVRRGREITDPDSGTAFELIEGYRVDEAGGRKELIGYAFPVWGVGFWAQIRGYLAVDSRLERIIGIVFVQHSETPGLGGRITERAWRAKFRGLLAGDPVEGGRHVYIGGDKPAGPSSPAFGRRVDAITGATGTSAAVERFLNERITQFRRAAKAAGVGASPGQPQRSPSM